MAKKDTIKKSKGRGDITPLKGKGFDKNPQNINKKGRPKSSISGVVSELKKEGYEIPSKQDISDAYLLFIGMEEEQIKKMTIDKNQSMLVRIVGKNLLSGKGFDIMERIIDRSLGKAIQYIDNTVSITEEDNPLESRLKEMKKKKK